KWPEDPRLAGAAQALARTRASAVLCTLVAQGPISRKEAAQLMHEGHVRHIIVKQGGCDRIVSIRDL
ncbi:MAG TPA: hypothetical protein VEV82_01535, partial [Actinomycetota bacterium]|nr:hypothetical protein [Actinomycetota bacterium]